MKQISLTDQPRLKEKAELVKRHLSAAVFEKMQPCLFKNGEFLCVEGERAAYLYIILDGRCRVFKTLENGKVLLVCHYEDIQVLGEFELFTDSIAKTTIQALGDFCCLAISVSEYKELLLADNQFLQWVCRQTCEKVERNNQTTGINLLYPLEQRLANYILVMQNDGVFFSNYTRLSQYLGCSHRHLLRTLGLLCKKQFLEKEDAGYRLKNPSALKQLAGNLFQAQKKA